MNVIILTCLPIIVVFGGLSGFAYLADRRNKARGQIGGPSLPRRIVVITVGLAGLGISLALLLEAGYSGLVFLLFSLILLGYGVFEMFAPSGFIPVGELQDEWGAPDNNISLPRKRLSQNAKFAIDWGIVIIICIGVAIWLFIRSLQDSGLLSVSAEYPDSVQVGDSFQLTLYLKNIGESDISVQDIAFWGTYNDEDWIQAGAQVASTEPSMRTLTTPFYSLLYFRPCCKRR